MKKNLPILLLVLLFAALPASAQNALSENEATIDYPNKVEFTLDVDDSIEIANATLRYDVDKFSCLDVPTDVPLDLDGDNDLSWTWEMIRSGNPPPGSELWWEWTITDVDGNTYTTDRQTTILNDERFEWQTVTADRINLHWYRGDDVGSLLLESAVEGLDRLENEMGIILSTDVDIYIYGTTQEMRDAILYVQDWAGGVAFTEYNTILIGVRPSEAADWGVRTVAHELAHLVLGQFGRSCVGGSRPTWLEEGLAQVAEGEPDSDLTRTLDRAIENNTVSAVRSLTGAFPAHGTGAIGAYSQSYSIVSYMLETNGPDTMQELILLLADGENIDVALEQLYGYNMDGLEERWREWAGVESVEIRPTLTPISADAIPTFAPVAAAQDLATPAAIPLTTPPAATSPSAGPSLPLCGLGFAPFLLLLVPVGWVQRQRKRSHYD